MKSVLLTLIIFSAIPAWTCQIDRNPQRLVCPGDAIVSPDNREGKVGGVNAYQNSVNIQFQYYNPKNYDIRDIFLAYGCTHGICVGDTVAGSNLILGTVQGINPHSGRVSIKYQYYNAKDFRIDEIYQGLGCASGICVKDAVITSESREGNVAGINPYTGMALITFQYYNNKSVDTRSLYIKNYCLDYDQSVREARLMDFINEYNFGIDRRQRRIEQPVQPIQPIEPIEPVQPIQPIQPIRPVQPVRPVEPVQPVQQLPTYIEPDNNNLRPPIDRREVIRGGIDNRPRGIRPGTKAPLNRTLQVSCGSQGYDFGKDFFGNRPQRTTCSVGGQILSAALISQQSNSACRQGIEWGYLQGSNNIWVQRGCRATFVVQIQ